MIDSALIISDGGIYSRTLLLRGLPVSVKLMLDGWLILTIKTNSLRAATLIEVCAYE